MCVCVYVVCVYLESDTCVITPELTECEVGFWSLELEEFKVELNAKSGEKPNVGCTSRVMLVDFVFHTLQ